jgi:hypothetical protein
VSRPATDYKGFAWGNWKVLHREGTSNRVAAWLCKCLACGHEQIIGSNRIRDSEGVVCESCEKQPPSKRALCTDEEFVRAWQTSANVPEVCQKLTGTRMQVHAIAGRLRLHGVPLKKMPKSEPRKYTELIELAKSLVEPH